MAHPIDLQTLWPRLSSWFPDAVPEDFSLLGEGLDHTVLAYRDLVVRIPRTREYVERAKAEYAILSSLAETSALVPKPLRYDAASGWRVLENKVGVLLNQAIEANEQFDSRNVARQVGRFLTELHNGHEELFPLPFEEWPDLAEYREEALRDLEFLRSRLEAATFLRLQDRLSREPPGIDYPLGLIHNDLGTEHVLVDITGSTVIGIIDWSDTCWGDPAVDLGRLFRDLGPQTFAEVLAHYGNEAKTRDTFQERVRYFADCFALEDARYGVEEAEPGFFQRGLAALAWTD